jgi:hypothetical protein
MSMHWIISNPIDAFQLAWSIALKYCAVFCLVTIVLAVLLSRKLKWRKKRVVFSTIAVMFWGSVAICGVRIYGYLNPILDTSGDHANYSSHFNDVQRTQIVAARKYGIEPLKDRSQAASLIKDGTLKRVSSCGSYQLAPMGHSIPYLTENAAELLGRIGQNFKDSLDAKGISSHKIVVTSILRTDADVAKLMKSNSVAVKNSAHRHATTFDISYTQFVPDGVLTRSNRNELKAVLAEVLRDLRDDKECYVKYEKSQHCFHITVRR